MDIRRLLIVTRKWMFLLVAGMVLAAVAAYLVSSQQQKTYEARTTLIVGQSLSSGNPDYSSLLASQQLATTYASIAETRSQFEAVIGQLGLSATPDDLARRVSAAVVSGSSLLTITVQDTDPARAAAIANALASGLVAEMSPGSGKQKEFQASLDAAIAATKAQLTTTEASVEALLALTTRTTEQATELATLQAQLVSLRSAYVTTLGMTAPASATNGLAVVDAAVAPATPIGPRILLNTLVAAILGLLAAAAVAALAEYRNDAVGDGEQVERLARSTLLATVGHLRMAEGTGDYPLATVLFPRSGAAEAYRTLRANLEFASVDKKLTSLLVTSAQPGEGKTLTAANIAVAWAQAGRRVLLMDADLRLPMINKVFVSRNEVGLTTALVKEAISLDGLVTESWQPNLWILPSGPLPPNPAELLSSQRMRTLLETAQASFDLVVLDSSPLAAVADAAVLGASVSATVIVVDAERGKRRALIKARDLLTRAGASVVGVVYNRAPGGRGLDESGHYGGYLRSSTQPVSGSQSAALNPKAADSPDRPIASAPKTR